MILKKITSTTARWDHSADTWWVGAVDEFCWTDLKGYEISTRMTLKDALRWITEYDIARTEAT